MNPMTRYGERFPRDPMRDDEAAPVYVCPRFASECLRVFRARRVGAVAAQRFRRSRRWTRTYDRSSMPW